MSAADIVRVILEGLLYDAIKYVAGPLIVTAAIGVVLRTVFGKLQAFKETIIFGVSTFCAIAVVFFILGSKPQQPQFVGGIQNAITGALTEHDTLLVMAITVMNSGSMQSIVKNISVEANINGTKYTGIFSAPPKSFTFSLPNLGPSSPLSLTYHSEDDFLGKAMYPIQSGSVMIGTLYVVFKNVNPEIFKSGADFTVNYEDVFSKRYAATIKTTAQLMPVGALLGLHTDMVCRPPDGKLPTAN